MCAEETPKFKGDISRNYRTEILPVGVVGGREETIITLLTERKKTKLKKNHLWRLIIIYLEIKFPLSFSLFFFSGYCSLWVSTHKSMHGNMCRQYHENDRIYDRVNMCDKSFFFFPFP